MSRIKPLPADSLPDLKETMETYRRHLGYVPNSPLVLARRPKIVKALAQMAYAGGGSIPHRSPLIRALVAEIRPGPLPPQGPACGSMATRGFVLPLLY